VARFIVSRPILTISREYFSFSGRYLRFFENIFGFAADFIVQAAIFSFSREILPRHRQKT
jgi:hypothetical protein